MIPEFSNLLLDLGILYGTIGGPEFSTLVRPLDSGFEGRFPRAARGRWDLGDTLYDQAEWEYLKTFFWQHRGAAVGFRWKDWSDYQATDQLIGFGDLVTTTYGIYKTYGSFQKRILCARPEGFEITLDDVVLDPGFYELDETGSLVTFSSPIDDGQQIRATYEFDKPVRFEQDSLNSRLDALNAETGEGFYFVSSLPIRELLSIGPLEIPEPPDPPGT